MQFWLGFVAFFLPQQTKAQPQSSVRVGDALISKLCFLKEKFLS